MPEISQNFTKFHLISGKSFKFEYHATKMTSTRDDTERKSVSAICPLAKKTKRTQYFKQYIMVMKIQNSAVLSLVDF